MAAETCDEIRQFTDAQKAGTWIGLVVSGLAITAVCYAGYTYTHIHRRTHKKNQKKKERKVNKIN